MSEAEHPSKQERHAFYRTESSQDESYLLLMPYEIRSIIFGYLLINEEPLAFTPTPLEYIRQARETREKVGWDVIRQTIRPNFCLYPGILTTCQKVYTEAYSVLYQCNTLAIHIELYHQWSEQTSWFILGEEGGIEANNRIAHDSILGQLRTLTSGESDPWNPHSRWRYSNILRLLPIFTRMQIKFSFKDSHEFAQLYSIFWFFRHVVDGKDVHVQISGYELFTSDEMLDLMERWRILQMRILNKGVDKGNIWQSDSFSFQNL